MRKSRHNSFDWEIIERENLVRQQASRQVQPKKKYVNCGDTLNCTVHRIK